MNHRLIFIWGVGFFSIGIIVSLIAPIPGIFFIIGTLFIPIIFFINPSYKYLIVLLLSFLFGIFYPFLYQSIMIEDRPNNINNNFIMRPLFNIKEQFTLHLNNNLSPSSSALAMGILFGDRSYFSPAFRENLKKSGTSHIVALSGFNITIIVAFMSMLFFFLPITVRPIATIIGIILFIILVGPSASVLRAAIMGSMVLFAKNIGRLIDIKSPIAFAVLVMILYNPLIIIYDAGFILSFMALFGIVFLAPKIKNIIFKSKDIGVIKSLLIECISAQIAVSPAIIILFNNFNLLSFIPNFMIIWTVPFAMAFSFASGMLSFISKWLAMPFSIMAEAILSYEIFIINFFARGF